MNRTQRLLELVYFLMKATRPVALAELREAFPDYRAENEESSRRKFERDKETLRQLGVAIRVAPDEETETAAYTIDLEETLLPPIAFEEDEVLALVLLSRVARHIEHFPLARQTDEALRKILYDRQDDPERDFAAGPVVRLPDEASNPRQREWIECIYDGIEKRKTLFTRYHTFWSDRVNDRAIDPYGLVYQEGRWSLIGRCHLRGAVRTFLVERFRDVRVNPRNPTKADYAIPRDFDLRKMRLPPPWLWEGEDTVEAEIEFTPKVAWQVEKSQGGRGRFEMRRDGRGRLTVMVSNPAGLIDWVLSFGEDACILRPGALRRELVSRVRGVAALHEREAVR
jgi:proteasome accessory factor B